MNALRAIVVVVAGMSACAPAWAGITLFLPGDAFFSSNANGRDTPYDAATQKWTLPYTRYSGWSMFCGIFGQSTLVLEGVPAEVAAAVRDVKQTLIAEAPPEPEAEPAPTGSIFGDYDEADDAEVEPDEPTVVLWVYDRQFDVTSRRLGLKFNERWPAEQKALGMHHAMYDAFHDDLVVLDWALSEEVPPLAVKQVRRVGNDEEAAEDEAWAREIEGLLASTDEAERKRGERERVLFKQEAMVATRPWGTSQAVMMLKSEMHAVMEREVGAGFYVVSDRVCRFEVVEQENGRRAIKAVEEKPLAEDAGNNPG